MRHLAGPALAGSLLLVACSGEVGGGRLTEAEGTDTGTVEGDATDADAYIEAVAESMSDDQEEFGLDEEAVTCMATVVVDLVGTDALTTAGVTPEDFADAGSFAALDVELPDDATARLSEGFAECDITDLMVDVVVEQLATGAGGELPSEASTCLEEALDRQGLLDAVAVGFIEGSDEEIQTLLFDTVAACPDVMTAVVLGEAAGSVGPEEQTCVRSVIENNADLVRSAFLDQDPDATQEFGDLVSSECPGVGRLLDEVAPETLEALKSS
jgi:hypothetical protein